MKKKIKEYDFDFSGILTKGNYFKGTLTFVGTFRIDCKFEGEIKTNDTLIIGENAEISAEISVGSLYIYGKVNGNIIANEKIEINGNAEVFGNIITPVLIISEGVIFQGNCSMREKGIDEKKLSLVI